MLINSRHERSELGDRNSEECADCTGVLVTTVQEGCKFFTNESHIGIYLLFFDSHNEMGVVFTCYICTIIEHYLE